MPVLFSFDLPLTVLQIDPGLEHSRQNSIPKPHHLLFPHAFVILCALVCLQTGLSLKQVGALLRCLTTF